MNNPFEPILNFIKNKEVYGPILTILICYIIYQIIKTIITNIMKKPTKLQISEYSRKKTITVMHLFTNVVKYAIFIIGLVIILQIYGIDTTSILASLGVLSAVLGLAFQDALKDFIGGVSIILENYYIVGDTIRYKDFQGKVIELGLKSTKVRNFNNEVLIIANRNVTEVVNLSQSKSNIIITIPVAYEIKTDKVEKSIEKIMEKLKEIKDVDSTTIKYLGIDALAESSVNYLVSFQTPQDKQWQARRDALKVIKDTFEEDKIKIPYNQIEVHNG